MDYIRFDAAALPADEHEAADYAQRNLTHLQFAALGFRSSVEFYMHIRELKRIGLPNARKVAWTKIAGRNGAIEAYGFWMAMQAIHEMKAPTIQSRIDMAKRKAGASLFAAEFPTVAGLRQTTAHPGEFSATPENMERHRITKAVSTPNIRIEEGGGVFIADRMAAGDDKLTFMASFKGKLVEYELSYAKADALDRVATLYLEAFFPLEDAITASQRQPPRPA